MKKERLYPLDNLKFLLIFAVVLGHLLEITPEFRGKLLILRIIYSFHMPAFLFLAGWFGKFRPRKIAFHFLYPYLLFQVFYLLSSQYIWTGNEQELLFSVPYWLLWYLLALIFYYLLLPMVDVTARWKQAVILIVSVCAALYAGKDSHVGYLFSSGRFFAFLPFFLLGFYMGKGQHLPLSARPLGLRLTAGLTCLGGVVLSCLYLWKREDLTLEMMYGVNSYETTQSGPVQRLILMAIALVWIFFLLTAVAPLLNRKLPVISTLGKNTFSIFLLHGLVVRYLGYCHYGFIHGLPLALGGAAALVLAFGNPAVAWFFRHFLTGWWLERLWGFFSRKKT